MTAEAWQNLALLAIAVFYVAQFGLDIYWHNMCGHLAIDYCAFWSVGRVAELKGYSHVYDMSVVGPLQQTVCPQSTGSTNVCETIPAPYLPVFLLPFQALSFLGPYTGYWLWTVVSLAVFLWYLHFFALKMTGAPLQKRILVLILLSWPVFVSFFTGQVNIWLTIFVGEYMRASMTGKPFRAGLWLGGLMIKPQFLILLGIALLLRRSIKVLAGLAVSCAVLLAVSYAMAGAAGMWELGKLLRGFAEGIAATGPSVMMNWRMVGLYLSTFANPTVAWSLIAVGMLLTAVLGIHVYRDRQAADGTAQSIALLGLLAATGAFAWHAHIASATIIICPLICLSQPAKRLPANALALWVILPPGFQFAVVILGGLIQAGTLPDSLAYLQRFLTAAAPFAFNLYFLLWAWRTQRLAPQPAMTAATA